MTVPQILLLLTCLVEVSWSQLQNGFINPLFLPRGLQNPYRRGRVYDPNYNDPIRDDRYYMRGGVYDDYRDDRRSPWLDYRYNDYRRNPTLYEGFRRYPTGLADQRYQGLGNYQDFRYQQSIGLASTANPLESSEDIRHLEEGRGQVLGRGLELDGRQYLDRGQILERGQGLDRRSFLDRGQILNSERPYLARGQRFDDDQILNRGQILDRGQILTTASPELNINVQPNGSS